jgi:galactose oxidase
VRLVRLLVLAVTSWSLLLIPAAPTAANAAVLGQVPDTWSNKIEFRNQDNWYVAPIHGTLMPDGRILFYGLKAPTADLSKNQLRDAFIFTPPSGNGPFPTPYWVQDVAQPIEADAMTVGSYHVYDTLECSGSTLTADGKLFTVGGTRYFTDGTSQQFVSALGLKYATEYDGTNWNRLSNYMVGSAKDEEASRWYPTVTRMPDGRLLVTSGFNRVEPNTSVNLSVESFDPASSSFSLVSSYAQTPGEIVNADYTHVGVLPIRDRNSDLVMLGSPGVPVLLSTANNQATWYVSPNVRPGSEAWNATRVANHGNYQFDTAPDYGASSVMLPIRVNNQDLGYSNGTMLVVGGAFNTPFIQAADRYDPQLDTWLPTIDTGVARHHPITIDLPDSRVLVIGGHSSDPNVTHAEYIDTNYNNAITLGTSDGGEVRGYHAVGLLLPDGRIIVAGGRDVVSSTSAEKPSFRIYSPYYMYVNNRPAIVSAPAVLGLAQQFQVGVSTSAPTGAMLIGLGSMTHSFDENQRAIQLAVSQVAQQPDGTWQATLTAPASAQVAQPGYYMLFITDGRRVPSVAKIVKLG